MLIFCLFELLLSSYFYYYIDFKKFFTFAQFHCKGSLIKYYSLVLILIFAGLVSSSAAAIEIVTHPQVTEISLTKSQLRRIYTMRQLRWSDDSAINVFVLPSQHELHQRFAKERLQIFPYQLNRIWHKLTYSGLGVAPTIVSSEKELIQAVTKTPGAIGYINDETLKKIEQNERIKRIENPSMEASHQTRSKGVVNVVKIKD
ncbi:type 2 periplasmic-binding domain-containing protein [Colwellia psychrerythraea]|uniref:PBP domain-containing protein n=1 Tax=Colwellia psychrerythraea TaxID=28229 RepID=A0A099K9J6_COLPS|nr:hypothetical protein [Colwellia psychrerythraea]KGJ87016.1 hypothetical protein ND2E_0423 [Colwellia psychrerythraea]